MSVEKMKKKIRKMSVKEKLELMNWLNTWYSYLKEEENNEMCCLQCFEEIEDCVCKEEK